MPFTVNLVSVLLRNEIQRGDARLHVCGCFTINYHAERVALHARGMRSVSSRDDQALFHKLNTGIYSLQNLCPTFIEILHIWGNLAILDILDI